VGHSKTYKKKRKEPDNSTVRSHVRAFNSV
jgi:hypothetical protein